MKIGLFGGTFNPIHNGHIKVICHVKEQFGLDEIHLIPAAVPPHKPDFNLASANDRLEMVQCSIKEISGLAASEIEIKRKGPSFTIDTIKQFGQMVSRRERCSINSKTPKQSKTDKKASYCNADKYHKITGENSKKHDLYLIMGSDAFFDIPTWKQNIEIFSLIPVIVMIRADDQRGLSDIAGLIKNMISDKYKFDNNTGAFLNPYMKTINIHKPPAIKLSSTMIRKRIKQNLPIDSMVHPCVEKIIREKGLYI